MQETPEAPVESLTPADPANLPPPTPPAPGDLAGNAEMKRTIYPINGEVELDLVNRFTYHPPKNDQTVRYVEIRDTGRLLAETICLRVQPSRELSLALTKIEEAIFWANAGIARHE